MAGDNTISRRTLVRAGVLATAGVAVPWLTQAPAMAAATRQLTWPAGWGNPLSKSSTTVNVSTNYGAYSKGCGNADTRDDYRWYLTSPSRKEHLGLDLATPADSPVYSMADGRILAVGELWGSTWKDVMLVQHRFTTGASVTAVYAHIARGTRTGTTKWAVGDMVRKGSKLGTVVKTGTGPHLHLGTASGTKTSVVGSSTSSGNVGTSCTRHAEGTVNPETHLKTAKAVGLIGSIVGYKNSDGTITSWRVISTSDGLRRNWVPTSSVYQCLKSAGAVDWGAMPSRFLDQIPDQKLSLIHI